MKSHYKINSVIWFLVAYLVLQNIPWLYYRVGSKGGLIFFVPWFISELMSSRRGMNPVAEKYARYFYLFFGLYWLVPWLYPVFDYGTFPDFGNITSNGQILVAFIIFHLISRVKDIASLRVVTFASVASLLISGIINSRVQERYEFASRELTGGNTLLSDAAEYLAAGVARYDFIFGMALIAPVLLYTALRTRNILRWIFVATYLFLGISVLQASYFIGTIAFLTGTALVVAYYQPFIPKRAALVIVYFPVVLFFVAPSVFSLALDPILWLMTITDNHQYLLKLGEVQSTIQAGFFSEYGPLGVRIGLYRFSFENYLNHPLWGNGTFHNTTGLARSGGHSQIFDMMANTGLVEITAVILIFWSFRKYVLAAFPNQVRDVQILMNLFMFPAIFVAFVNPLRTPPIWSLFLLLTPSLVTWFRDFDQKEMEGRKRMEERAMSRGPYV